MSLLWETVSICAYFSNVVISDTAFLLLKVLIWTIYMIIVTID